jgi:hypothetical protein
MVINRLPEPELTKAPPGAVKTPGMKNVTPKKKKG